MPYAIHDFKALNEAARLLNGGDVHQGVITMGPSAAGLMTDYAIGSGGLAILQADADTAPSEYCPQEFDGA